MRRDKLWINNSAGLRQLRNDLREVLKQNHTLAIKELEITAERIRDKAVALVPVGPTLNLLESIDVTVSRSPRYPGLVVTATAKNPRTGYDYARIQEENTEYKHEPGRQAHYLSQPFREEIADFYRRMGW